MIATLGLPPEAPPETRQGSPQTKQGEEDQGPAGSSPMEEHCLCGALRSHVLSEAAVSDGGLRGQQRLRAPLERPLKITYDLVSDFSSRPWRNLPPHV